MKKGKLLIISGFSGVGKGTVVKYILDNYSDYKISISATTRSPREGEVDGTHYHFLTTEKFEDMIKNNQLLEYANYVGNYYGTPRSYVEEQMAAGRDVILEIEIQGALEVKKKFPDTLLLFVTPPSATVLEERLRGRGTETEEVIQDRLKRASEEAMYMEQYDYILVNDTLETCVEQMHQLIQSQHEKVSENLEFIEKMKTELKQL